MALCLRWVDFPGMGPPWLPPDAKVKQGHCSRPDDSLTRESSPPEPRAGDDRDEAPCSQSNSREGRQEPQSLGWPTRPMERWRGRRRGKEGQRG